MTFHSLDELKAEFLEIEQDAWAAAEEKKVPTSRLLRTNLNEPSARR